MKIFIFCIFTANIIIIIIITILASHTLTAISLSSLLLNEQAPLAQLLLRCSVLSLCRVQPVTASVLAPPHRHPSSPKPHDLVHLVTQSLPSFLPSFVAAAWAVPPPNLLVALLILFHSSSSVPGGGSLPPSSPLLSPALGPPPPPNQPVVSCLTQSLTHQTCQPVRHSSAGPLHQPCLALPYSRQAHHFTTTLSAGCSVCK